MTSLIAWVGVDRQAASMYFASDSRLTWRDNRQTKPVQHWESGRKLFASRRTPDIFGFFGDAIFPSQLLSVLIDLIDYGALLDQDQTAKRRHQIVCELIKTAFERRGGRTPRDKFSIIHGARDGEKMKCTFHLWKFSYDNGIWRHNEINTWRDQSALLVAEGTGAPGVQDAIQRQEKTGVRDTTRAIFTGFCESIVSEIDPYSGGAAQLVGLYRIEPGLTFGTVLNGQPFLYGIPAGKRLRREIKHWRNEVFEIVDPITLRRKKGAKIHSKPMLP